MREVTLAEFLDLILPGDSLDDDELLDIAQGSDYREWLGKYCDASREPGRYHPYAMLTNYTLDEVNRRHDEKLPANRIHVQFCRNDPVYIDGSDSLRKPDGGVAEKSMLQSRPPRNPAKCVSKGPTEDRFFWAELFGFLEFKFGKGRVKEAFQQLLNILEERTKRSASPSRPTRPVPKRRSRAAMRSGPSTTQSGTSISSSSNSGVATSDAQRPKGRRKSGPKSSMEPPAGLSSMQTRSSTRIGNAQPAIVHGRSNNGNPPATPSSSSRTSTHPVLDATARVNSRTSSKRSSATAMLPSSDAPATKRPKTDNDEGPDAWNYKKHESSMVQCASYALELLSYGGWRSHVLGALITDEKLELLYFNHSAIIKSEAVDFVANPLLFVKIVAGLCRLSREQWGFHPLMKQPPGFLNTTARNDEYLKIEARGLSNTIYENITLTLGKGLELCIQDTISIQHCLIGRGTCVVRAKVVKVPRDCEEFKDILPYEGQVVVVKLSWPSASRESEAKIVGEARAIAIKTGETWVLKHLPNILYSEDYQSEGADGESTVQQRLAKKFSKADDNGDRYEERVLRIIVEDELLPIDRELKDGCRDLYNVFYDVYKCE